VFDLTGDFCTSGSSGPPSASIHIIDTKPDPRTPQIVKVIEPETVPKSLHEVCPRGIAFF
jgi:hypothetical protein